MNAIKLLGVTTRRHQLVVPTLSSTGHLRTLASGTRGARGHGWLKKYRAGLGGRHLQGRWHYRDVDELNAINDEVFGMNASLAGGVDSKTEAYLDLSVAGESPRRIVIELASLALPKTSKNFRLLCQEKGDDSDDKGGGEAVGTTLKEREITTGRGTYIWKSKGR